MNLSKLLTCLAICLLQFGYAQNLKKAEKTVMRFVHYVSELNLAKASEMMLQTDAELGFMEYSFGFMKMKTGIRISEIETYPTEMGAASTCYILLMKNIVEVTFELTEVEGKWMIYEVNMGNRFGLFGMGGNEDQPAISDQKLKEIYGTKLSPAETVQQFVLAIARKDYSDAQLYTILDAAVYFKNTVKDSPESLPVSISDIEITYQNRTANVNARLTALNRNGESVTFNYTLIAVGKTWKIISMGAYGTVEAVVENFVRLLADGKCESALQMTSGTAAENVQGSIDAGCTSYNSSITSITCEVSGDTALCQCTEKRDGMDMTFDYNLQKMDGAWMVTDYKKDLKMEDGDSWETVEEVVEEDMETLDMAKIYDQVDTVAQYPGGSAEMAQFIYNELRYPQAARDAGITGTVTVKFVVERSGYITHIQVIKGLQKAMDEEAVRIVEAMPKWSPAKVGDAKVKSWCTVDIHFTIK